MQPEQLAIKKLQTICDNTSNKPKVFGLVIYDFIKEYDENPILQCINANITCDAQNDRSKLEDLSEKVLLEMELAYYEFKDYASTSSSTYQYTPFNDIRTFVMWRDKSMAVINDPMIGRYCVLRDFVLALGKDEANRAKQLLKQSTKLDENGEVQEYIFAPSFDLWEQEKKRLESIQESCIWYSWDKLVYFYLNYGHMHKQLKESDLEEYRYHMKRVLDYTVDFFARSKLSRPLNKEREYKILSSLKIFWTWVQWEKIAAVVVIFGGVYGFLRWIYC